MTTVGAPELAGVGAAEGTPELAAAALAGVGAAEGTPELAAAALAGAGLKLDSPRGWTDEGAGAAPVGCGAAGPG